MLVTIIRFLPILLVLSCAKLDKIAANSTASMINTASIDMLKEPNYINFQKGTLPNLKFVEGLLAISPENKNLLLAALKANSGFAFGHHEVKIIENKLSKDASKLELVRHQELALMYYSKALHWGNQYWQVNDIFYKDLLRAHQNNKLTDLIDSELDESEFEFVFYYAQTLAALINLQRKSAIMLAQLSLAKDLFDYVCVRRPGFNHGACDIFYGAYEVGRPKMFGGDKQKGKAHFTNGLQKYPNNQLIRSNYIIFSVLAERDKKEFNKQMGILKDFFKKWKKQLVWRPGQSDIYGRLTNLFNAIAYEHFKILQNIDVKKL